MRWLLVLLERRHRRITTRYAATHHRPEAARPNPRPAVTTRREKP